VAIAAALALAGIVVAARAPTGWNVEEGAAAFCGIAASVHHGFVTMM